MRYFYKVVRRNKLSLLSANERSNPINYYLDREVVPKITNSKIFIFNTLQYATNYIAGLNHTYEIYKCTAKNPKKYPWDTVLLTIQFWKSRDKCYLSSMMDIPKGTYLADSVTLLNEVNTKKYFYKVVGEDLFSTGGTVNTVKYSLGEWTYPLLKNSKLFVFDTFKNAQKFAANHHRIFKCVAQGTEKPKYVSGRSAEDEDFWDRRIKKKKTSIWTINAPQGTYFANAVYLLEEL